MKEAILAGTGITSRRYSRAELLSEIPMKVSDGQLASNHEGQSLIIRQSLEKIGSQYNLLYKNSKSPDGLDEAYLYSDDKMYRYAFARWWGEGPLVLWIMLNPTKRDTDGGRRQTLTLCINWSQYWNYSGLIIANLFAFRCNDPKGLSSISHRVGSYNDTIIKELDEIAYRTIVAWGNGGYLKGRSAEVGALLKQPLCLGITAKGQPHHPIGLSNNATLQHWKSR